MIAEKSKTLKKIELKGISKAFPGVQAVSDVDFTLESGCVHALVGENGAGKSTLMKILAGVVGKDKGKILIDQQDVSINNPIDARKHGISLIQQEFTLFSEMNVFQNVFVGQERNMFFNMLIDWRSARKQTLEMLADFGLKIDISTPVKELKTSEQQIIEIAKSIYFGSSFIIMDEPTSSLDETEKEKLFTHIRELKRNNIGIIYISHRLKEIFEIADFITVMRDGRKIATVRSADVDEKGLIRMMVGREIEGLYSREKRNAKTREILRVDNLTRKGSFYNISFSIREGEVLGLSGLMGSQRTEIARCIFGIDRYDEGAIYFDGRRMEKQNTARAIKLGIRYVSEDRKNEGICPSLSVRENLILSSLDWVSTFGYVRNAKCSEIVETQVQSLQIKLASARQLISKLSGGNQQKVILGRCLAVDPRLIILDEPTRGIDVGAKAEVHKIMNAVTERGVAILFISSELQEIVAASDRIIVLHQGRITDEYSYRDATQEKIMASALK
jgi:ribose transport system ATP-binding protein